MALTREQQKQFARELVPLLEQVTDARALEQLHKLAAFVLEWSGFEDNGMAFAMSEYSFELAETAKGSNGKNSPGWLDVARSSVERELAQSEPGPRRMSGSARDTRSRKSFSTDPSA